MLASSKLWAASPICFRLFCDTHPGGGLADLLDGREEQPDQDRDDRDDDEQLDERERAAASHVDFLSTSRITR